MKVRGFILLPVVFAIAVIAAIAFMLNRGGPMALELGADDAQSARARQVAEAGMQHALWRANHLGCAGYALASTAFGSDSYSANYSAASGSPVTVTVTATLAGGATRSLTRSNTAIYQIPPAPQALQPDPNGGMDTLLDESKSTTNFGASQTLYVSGQSGSRQRSLFRFNLVSIPFGARVLQAKLELYQLTSGSTTAGPLNIHGLTSSWSEGTGNGSGSNDANWQNRITGTNWNSAGGDFDPAPSASTTADASGNTWLAWDITTLTQQWLSGQRNNYGLMVKTGNSTTQASFASSDNSTASQRPKLTITYACECGSPCSGELSALSAKLLFVVNDAASLDGDDNTKLALFQDWGYIVTLASATDAQATFNTNMASNDVAYVSETINPSDLGSKLVATTKGVVYEEGGINSAMGVATGFGQVVGKTVTIADNTHEITQPFATGAIDIYRYAMEGLTATGTLAPGGKTLATWGANAGLIAVDKGAALTSGSAAGRRVMLPVGRDSKFNPAYLNNNGRLILQRSLDWAAKSAANMLAAGLVAYWKLDDSSGNKAVDSVGGHDGTLVNSPTWTTGKMIGALSFNGTNNYITVPDDPALSLTSAMSFSAWINVPAFSNAYKVIINKDPGGTDSDYWFGTKIKDLAFGFWTGGLWHEVATSGLNLAANTWYLVGATFDNATHQVVLYVNGIAVQTGTLNFSPVANTTPLQIGNSPDLEYWRGTLDDVRMYNRVLSAAEETKLYTDTGGTCAGTLLDQFNAKTYTGSDGTLSWATNWTEVNEADGATSGDEQVAKDTSNYQLRVANKGSGSGEGVMRSANLSAYTSATLSFDYRRVLMSSSNYYVAIQASKDGVAWTEVGRIAGPTNDATYQSASFDISPYVGTSTTIRFLTSSSMTATSIVWFDNVQISASGCAP